MGSGTVLGSKSGNPSPALLTVPQTVIPTGCESLDRYLPGGGWPHGAITEIFIDRYGIGELRLLIPALAFLTRRDAEDGRWVVWVAPPFIPYAPALARHGVRLDCMLLVHPSAGMKDCLWAIEQAVRSKSSAAVLAWVSKADDVALRRLQLAAEERRCWTVLFRPMRALQDRSPAALRLLLFDEGSGIGVKILKCRGGHPGTVALGRCR